MTLKYFNGDYVRGGTNINSLSTGSSQVSFNGNIIAQSWRSSKPGVVVGAYGSGVNDPAMFTYEYADRYQFNNNKYGTPNFVNSTFAEAVNQNRDYGLSYDKYGNNSKPKPHGPLPSGKERIELSLPGEYEPADISR